MDSITYSIFPHLSLSLPLSLSLSLTHTHTHTYMRMRIHYISFFSPLLYSLFSQNNFLNFFILRCLRPLLSHFSKFYFIPTYPIFY